MNEKMPILNRSIVDGHRQVDEFSCIPSCVEIILKLLGKVPIEYYELQTGWGNNELGNFGDFNNRIINDVKFLQEFTLPRNDNFPLADLFAEIENELRNGRFVAVSLSILGGYHMYVVYDIAPDGEFLAVSKNGGSTIYHDSVKTYIATMKGTDILIYRPI